jgi:hypothetical protein
MGSNRARSKRGRPRSNRPGDGSVEPQSETPPVMWPSTGSGFEADPFSPAGMAQQQWTILKGGPRGLMGRVFVWAIVIIIALVLISPLLVFIK